MDLGFTGLEGSGRQTEIVMESRHACTILSQVAFKRGRSSILQDGFKV